MSDDVPGWNTIKCYVEYGPGHGRKQKGIHTNDLEKFVVNLLGYREKPRTMGLGDFLIRRAPSTRNTRIRADINHVFSCINNYDDSFILPNARRLENDIWIKRDQIHLYELLWGTMLEDEIEVCLRFCHK